MLVVNLDPQFAPATNKSLFPMIFSEGHPGNINIPHVEFPSGIEPHTKLPEIMKAFKNVTYEKVLITCRIKTMNDFFRLLLCTDALRRISVKEISVFIPYMPFARQDRVMTWGEPLSLKVIASLLNQQHYEKVYVYDPHSEMTAGLIDCCEVISNHSFVKMVLSGIPENTIWEDYHIVCPDAGAYKKIFAVCQHIGYKGEIIMCNKLRDVNKKGVLHSVTVSHEELNGKPCFIIDDICDGGGTFNLLADELKRRNAGPIHVIVSHGIFSKGFDVFPNISKIFTTDSFKTITEPHHKCIQIGLSEIEN